MAASSAGATQVHDHTFSVSRNAALLRSAFEFTRGEYQSGALRTSIYTRNVGHWFPTGDIFRKVTVTVAGLDSQGRVVCGEEFAMARDWRAHRESIRTHGAESFVGDTRLGYAPRVLSIACSAEPVRMRLNVVYARGKNSTEQHFEAFEQLELLDEQRPVTLVR
jgi:hypothetical protein